MNIDVYSPDFYIIEEICRGHVPDVIHGIEGDKTYRLESVVVRLSPAALNAWNTSFVSNCRECYDTDMEYEEYLEEKETQRKAVEARIQELVGLPGGRVSQSIAEIFNVTKISAEVTPCQN